MDINTLLMEELHDERKARLVDEFNEIIEMNVDSAIHSCLWLADIDILEDWVNKAREENAFILPMLNAKEAQIMLKTWMSLKRNDNKKRKDRDDSAPRPSKIPKLAGSNLIAAGVQSSAHSESGTVRRSKPASKLCSERDKNLCLITGVNEPLQSAHIYPFPLGKQKGTAMQRVFWSMLRLFWSQEKVARWADAVLGPEGSETCANMLTMSNSVHALWGNARIALKPLTMSDDQKSMKVQFFWLPQGTYSPGTQLDRPPPTATSANTGPLMHYVTRKDVCSGDIFIFETEDPTGHPLPSFALLEMQWILHRVAALSGAAEFVPDDDSDSESEVGEEVEHNAVVSAVGENRPFPVELQGKMVERDEPYVLGTRHQNIH